MIVELILDSNVFGARITLFRLTYSRTVHSEVLRHRKFSICSSSSRAIPLSRMIEQYCNFYPDKWRLHQPGMQPNETSKFSDDELRKINNIYARARSVAIASARQLHEIGVSKEQVNRLIEPYSTVTHLMQGTEYSFEDFFKLRNHPTAQYEVRMLAKRMEELMKESEPTKRKLHIPFMYEHEMNSLEAELSMRVSAARCARTSYYNHDGKEPNIVEDLKLSRQLLKDKHMSPFEFCVMDPFYAKELSEKYKDNDESDLSGNLGMNVVQFRKLIEGSYI